MPASDRSAFDLSAAPGHLLRRAQQRAVEIFAAEMGDGGPTPPQFALLAALQRHPGASQIALVQAVGIDRSTLAEMVRRLAQRGWIRRQRARRDGRENALHLTAEGARVLARSIPAAQRAQERILQPVPAARRKAALALLLQLANYPGKSSP